MMARKATDCRAIGTACGIANPLDGGHALDRFDVIRRGARVGTPLLSPARDDAS
jgi:hypothetical protein